MSEYKIERILNGRLAEYCYLIHSIDSKDCICIDPGYDVERIMNYVKKNSFIVKVILLTHGHFDHILSCFDMQKEFNCDIYISKEDEELLFNAEHNYSNLINKTSFDKFEIKDNVKDGDELNFLGFKIKCIGTPGHTKGGISYYFENEKILFSGDTLFFETFGRIDLYGGSYKEIKDSIENKLFALPNDTMVYPGHGELTSIGKEKLHNEIRRMSYEL